MRYEVRVYNLEEMVPENRMTYTPCDSREEAVRVYKERLTEYNDGNHEVELCVVNYLPYGESARVCASTRHADPKHVVWEEEYIGDEEVDEPEYEDECYDDGCVDVGNPYGYVDPYEGVY